MTEKEYLDGLDKKLWKSADMLRSNLDAAVYKHAVLGLIFLKYVSDSFEEWRKWWNGYRWFKWSDPLNFSSKLLTLSNVRPLLGYPPLFLTGSNKYLRSCQFLYVWTAG